MTWADFETNLNIIDGVFAFREMSGDFEYLIVSVRGRRIDYFLIISTAVSDDYMARHYISVIRMLAGFI